MGKVRTKDIKKRVGGDFKRKKAKVGRKVERANVTKISVVSKRITLPLQAALTENRDETARIDGLIRLMQHYSPKNRSAALAELQGIFESNTNARRYLGITLPHVLELLFDGSAEVHRAMVDLLTSLLNRFDAADFASVAPVLVTYICSGLTSLNLAIRKDTLVALHTICTLQPAVLMIYCEKIFDHLLTLIESSLVEGGVKESFSSGVDVVANASALVTAKVASVQSVKRKKQESADKAKAKKKAHGSSVLLLSLKIFAALLSSFAEARESAPGPAEEEGAATTQLRSCRRDCLLFAGGGEAQTQTLAAGDRQPSGDAEEASAAAPSAAKGLSLESPVLLKMCAVLRRVWSGYMPQEPSPLPVKLEVVLRAMSDVVRILSRCVGSDPALPVSPVADELRRTLAAMCAQHPYAVLESSCAETGKKRPRRAPAEEGSAAGAAAEEGSSAEDSDSDSSIPAAPPAAAAHVEDTPALRDAQKRFQVLNMLIAQSVMSLHSTSLCEKYVHTVNNRDRKDTQLFLSSYQLVRGFVERELRGAVALLGAAAPGQEAGFELTPKEYYNLMFSCLRLGFVQANRVASQGFSDEQLRELSVGAPDGPADGLASALGSLLETFLQLGTGFRCKGYIPFVDACVRCVCGVAEETVDRLASVLGDSARAAGGPVPAILRGLAAALSLMGTHPAEPGELTLLLAGSAVRCVTVSDDALGPGGEAARGALHAAVLQLFRPSEGSSADEEGTPVYTQAGLLTRLRLLDLWALAAPPAEVMGGAESILDCLRSMAEARGGGDPPSELRYFLRLFHMRRHDASLAEFKDFVFGSIEGLGVSYREVIADVILPLAAVTQLSRASLSELYSDVFRQIGDYVSCVREVWLSLLRCSSPEQPHKLVSKLLDPVAAMLDALEDACDDTEDATRTFHLFWAGGEAAGLLAMLNELLSCCGCGEEGAETRAGVARAAARALGAVLRRLHAAADCDSRPGLDAFTTGPAMKPTLTPWFLFSHSGVGCLELLECTVSVGENGTGADDGSLSFHVFDEFIDEHEKNWKALSLDAKLTVLKAIKEFYRRNEFRSCIAGPRLKIESFVNSVKSEDKSNNADIVESLNDISRFIS